MERPSSSSSGLQFQQRVQALFEHALELSAEERGAWLARECGSDHRLKAEIDGLLAVMPESERFLDGEQAAQSFRAVESVDPGELVGPYEVVREIGRGGMGVVLLARRADGQFQQQVALKLLRRGMDSEAILASFLRERQILAWLQHPHIARLYDGGLTQDGRPWFALEYVEGRPINEYCEAEELPLRSRVELTIDACGAIQHAHRNLVIHRDLKPSNVLVTDEGEVKLLDFGIAKVLRESEALALGTSLGGGAMTPEYAAPEQLRQEPVTTATDIHALGVLLYELLTGQRPYRFGGESPQELARVVTDTRVKLPSAVATGDGARRLLRGDLDTIVLKAIHKDPDRRYGTAEAFADDLRRYLAGRPVTARRDTVGYRLSKFVQRNRWGLAAATVVVLVIAAAAVFTARESALTERERARTQSVKDFLVNLVHSANPNAEGGAALRDEAILDVALERAETELGGEPDMQAELYDVVGKAWVARGDLSRAVDPLTKALELQRKIHGDLHPGVADAAYGMAGLLRRQGRYEEAETFYQEALDIQVALQGRRSLDAAALLNGLGANAYGAGDLDRAERYYRESLAVKEDLLEEDDLEIATGRHNLALLLRRQKKYEAAEELMRQALEARERASGDTNVITALSRGGLGRILHSMKRYDEAAEQHRRALEIRLAAYGSDHPHTRLAHANLALVLYDGGDLAGAAQEFRSLLSTVERDLGETHPECLTALCNLAEVLLEQERLDEAEAALAEAGERVATLEVDDGGWGARVLAGRGALHLARGDANAALPTLEEAVQAFASLGQSDTRGGLKAQVRLGECLSLLERSAEADSTLLSASLTLDRELEYTWEARLAHDRLREHRVRTGYEDPVSAPD